jgi:hypothetical protein
MASEDWFAFSMPWDDGTSTFVSANLEAPAGEHGFVQVTPDGDFYFEDGQPARFWGAVLSQDTLCPPKEVAEKLARRLAKLGFNLVRIVGLDAVIFESGAKDTRHFDDTKLDRFDYLVSRLKDEGVYIDIVLVAFRTFRSGDEVIDWNAPEFVGNYEKQRLLQSMALFDPYHLYLQREYAQELLSHMNPYTGNTYAKEPGVAMLEIVNETTLTYGWLRDSLNENSSQAAHITTYYSKELDVLWNLWLLDQYGSREELSSAWAPETADLQGLLLEEDPMQGNVSRILYSEQDLYSKTRVLDLLDYYYELEASYFTSFRVFLDRQVGVSIPVSGTHTFHGMANQLAQAQMDFTGSHVQWEHPLVGSGWTQPFRLLNTPMVQGEAAIIPYKADWIETKNTLYRVAFGTSVAGKPMVISEYNHAFPNEYQAEFPLIIGAYAGFQGWDSFVIHSYVERLKDLESNKIEHLFTSFNNPIVMAQIPVASLLFRQGYVQKSEKLHSVSYSKDEAFDCFLECGLDIYCELERNGIDPALALVHEVRSSFESTALEPPASATKPENPYISDTGELAWDMNRGLVIIDTDFVQAAIGFLKGRSVSLKNMTIQATTDFAAISLISLDGEPIETSEKLLLTAASRVKNQGMVVKRDLLGLWVLEDWGEGPVLVQDVQARIQLNLPNFRAVQVSRLDELGQLSTSLPARSKDGGVSFEIGGQETLWYGITTSAR